MTAEANDATPPVLLVEHLTKRFGDRVAVEDVSFSVAAGEVFGFLGPNGAGKTTTVRMLATLLEPSAGGASSHGMPLEADNGLEIRQRIAVMPENPGLYLRLTVAENLEFFAGDLRPAATAQAGSARARAREPRQTAPNDLCGSLSKGLRQRVGLARALLSDPAIVFLDEPTSGLDPVASREVHELIDGLRDRGVTVFLTTHRLEEAERLCDRVRSSTRRCGRSGARRAPRSSLRKDAPRPHGRHRSRTRRGFRRARRRELAEPGTAGYVLTVSEPHLAAPKVTRASSPQAPICSRSARINTRSRTSTSNSIDDDVEEAHEHPARAFASCARRCGSTGATAS